jgi:NAD(P)-dependent dehydrogenase (short-subunit alcohol dehydrogenase family)
MTEATSKIALVTGAGTGVGRAASLALMNAGYTVVLAGRRIEMLEETSKLGPAGKSLCVSADMANPAAIAALFDKVKATYGRLDVLFNNAGMGAPPVNFEVHPARLPHHEGPEAARRPHHQQRLDLGTCAATVLGGLHLDQARHHRPHQGFQPRRPDV